MPMHCCCGHAVPVLACRDGGKHSNLDCILPESFEGDKVICFAGVVATEDPCLVLFREESHAVENTYADVNVSLSMMGWPGRLAKVTKGFGTRRFSLVMAPSVDHKVKMRSFGMGLKLVSQYRILPLP